MVDLRREIDQVIMEEILKDLEKEGIPKDQCQKCYDKIRFYVEARAVLLNRVPERLNEELGYYREYLYQVAESLGIQIKLPYEPESN